MEIRNVCLVLFVGLLAACTAPPEGVTPINGFAPERYMGKWYEIARLDHSFERGLRNVTADYTLEADGTVTVVNRGLAAATCEWQEAIGHAEFLGAADVASLKVTFFWPFSGGYHIIALDDAYSYALVAGPSFDYLWVLSRTPVMDAAVRTQLVEQAASLGFDKNQLITVEQNAPTCVAAADVN